eukprot:6178422-Lingulodinium_polyedra.AAC.1
MVKGIIKCEGSRAPLNVKDWRHTARCADWVHTTLMALPTSDHGAFNGTEWERDVAQAVEKWQKV